MRRRASVAIFWRKSFIGILCIRMLGWRRFRLSFHDRTLKTYSDISSTDNRTTTQRFSFPFFFTTKQMSCKSHWQLVVFGVDAVSSVLLQFFFFFFCHSLAFNTNLAQNATVDFTIVSRARTTCHVYRELPPLPPRRRQQQQQWFVEQQIVCGCEEASSRFEYLWFH